MDSMFASSRSIRLSSVAHNILRKSGVAMATPREFVWHKHDDTDDFFLVLSGRIIIQLRDGAVRLGPGEVFVVPKGVEHRPVAEDEAHILLIEPRGTPNTGNTATAAARRVI
jgi:mannose-6-phosphate isomerase-like protein (cupin superfamily)